MRFLHRLKGVSLKDRQLHEDKRNLVEVNKMTDDINLYHTGIGD
jgi:hypothetical protein